jgi:hypothetical protein
MRAPPFSSSRGARPPGAPEEPVGQGRQCEKTLQQRRHGLLPKARDESLFNGLGKRACEPSLSRLVHAPQHRFRLQIEIRPRKGPQQLYHPVAARRDEAEKPEEVRTRQT